MPRRRGRPRLIPPWPRRGRTGPDDELSAGVERLAVADAAVAEAVEALEAEEGGDAETAGAEDAAPASADADADAADSPSR